MTLEMKYEKLKSILKDLESVVIGFSGGVDSTFLLKVAKDTLGDDVLAVTARSSTYPEREFLEAKEYAKNMNAKHEVIVSEELDIEGFSKNPIDRCYHCKSELFTKIHGVAKEKGYKYVLDGSNLDDVGDFRPGMKAAKELGVRSPLKEAEMTKEDIRTLSERLDLPTWNKPAFACLSSRFPYGNEITEKKLSMVEKAEEYLRSLGIIQSRVRHHENIARIEVNPKERKKFFDEDLMDEVGKALKGFGFTYVTLDILGYRSGSMNEVLSDEEKNLSKE